MTVLPVSDTPLSQPQHRPRRRGAVRHFITTQPLGTAGLVIILIMLCCWMIRRVGGAL